MKKNKRKSIVRTVFLLVFIILAILIGRIYQLKHNPIFSEMVYVKRVVDGDTFIDSQKRRYRLIGVNTPELKHGKTLEQPFAKEATTFTKNQIENKSVKLQYTKTKYDRYKRLLVYVYTPEGKMLNRLLLEEGLAEVYRKASHKFKKEFYAIEKDAQDKNKGMWSFKGNK